MELLEIKIPKATFQQLQESEQILVIQFGHAFNELTCLRKLLESVIDLETEGIERSAMVHQSLFVSRIFVGKLHEVHEMIRKVLNSQEELSKFINSKLSDDGKKSYKLLKQHLKKKNFLAKIRNDFSFHYSSDHLSTPGESLSEEGFVFYLCNEVHDNSYYISSETITTEALLRNINEEDLQSAMNKYLNELRFVSNKTIAFLSESCETVLVEKLGASLTNYDSVSRNINPKMKLGEANMPFFIKR
ncbi:MAG: hypothetical protein AB8D52_03535 [Gammaproteobacteria bacterium]